MVLRARNPRTQGQDCDGNIRSVGVDMQTQPGSNTLKISGSVLESGIVLSAGNIVLVAEGRDRFSIDAKINVVRDQCGIAGMVPGGEVHFWAQVNNVPPGDSVAYAWSVSGASVIGATAVDIFKIRLGKKASFVNVQVIITVEGVSQTVTLRFTPDTKESVRAKQLRCRLTSLLRANLFVDPLWDPLRDYIAQPLNFRNCVARSNSQKPWGKRLQLSWRPGSRRICGKR